MFKNMFGAGLNKDPEASTQPTQGAQDTGVGDTQQPANAVAADQVQPHPEVSDPQKAGLGLPENPTLDNFAKVLQNSEDATGSTEEAPVNATALTQQVLEQAKVDPLQSLPDSVKVALNQADEDTQQLLSGVASSVYTSAMQHMAVIFDQLMQQQRDASVSQVDKVVTSKLDSNALKVDNPLVAAEKQRVASQLRAKFPNAPSEWIAKHADNYFKALAESITPPPQQDATNLPEQVDYAELFELK